MPRHFSTLFLILFFSGLSCSTDTSRSTSGLDLSDEVTIDAIRAAYRSGEYTIRDLTQYYLDRIEAMNLQGPELRAVLTVNPDALEIARALDEEMENGNIRGPMHGIPVLLKDNIDTGDGMPNTAGARAMQESYPTEDSPLAAQLRAAGAVILGKANLSEWANFHSNSSSSGWSGLGGQTKNPYDLTRNPCGSSAGSGVAVAANLCVIAIGTETNGSIVCPANNNGIVGIKPTVGLISRRGIIPISFTQDTGGPMARTVRDAAICLGTLTAVDSLDAKTLDPDRQAYSDYTPFLREEGLEGKRLGFWKSPLGDHTALTRVMEQAVDNLEAAGATVVEIEEQPLPESARTNSFTLMLYEFKDGLNQYFASLGPDAPVKDLADLIEQTFADSVEMAYHDHDLFRQAQEKGELDEKEYLDALAEARRLSRSEGIDRVMEEYDLDAIIAPTGGPAWKTDLINGDNFGTGSSSPAAIAGYPNITVPMGQIHGLPVGISFFGKAWTEPVLLEIAYGYEQATQHRFSPSYLE